MPWPGDAAKHGSHELGRSLGLTGPGSAHQNSLMNAQILHPRRDRPATEPLRPFPDLPPVESRPAPCAAHVTVIVPAYNEAASAGDTVRSILAQALPVAHVVVVDDCSTDGTGAVARACGATVVRPPANTGS